MKFILKYTFGSEWHTHSEHETMIEAKRAMKPLKKHIGTYGKVKIVKVA